MAQVHGTLPTSGSDTFHRQRRTGIGGADAAAIEGVSPWQSALALYEEKRGIAPPRDEPNEVMLWGTRLEHTVRRGYVEDTGIPVTKPDKMLRHPDIPWLIGHLDGWTPREHPKARLLEVKTAQRLDERWGEPGSADVPLPYFVQVQHYMALTGYTLTDLAVLVSGRQMHVYTVPADQSYIDALLADEADFWRRVQEGDPPPPDGSDSAGAVLRRMYPTATDDAAPSTPEMAVAVAVYLGQRDVRDEAQRRMDREAQRIQAFMGARGRLVVPGATVAWSNRAGSTAWKEVAARYRSMLHDFVEAGPEVFSWALFATLAADEALDRIEAAAKGDPTRVFSVTPKVER